MKIYFWVIAILSFLSTATTDSFQLLDVIDLLIGLIGLVGLYGYAYQKKIFKKKFWKDAFAVIVIWDTIYSVFLLREEIQAGFNAFSAIVSFCILLPLFIPYYVSLYKYAYN